MSRLTSFESIEERDTEWFLDGWIPYGEVTVLGGDPKVGKSLLTILLAALASRENKPVLGAWSEDSPQAVRRRLRASEAVLSNVFQVRQHELVLPGSVNELEMMVMESGAKLIVLDHWGAFLDGDIVATKAQQVYRAISPLVTIARRHNLAVLLVCHLNVANEGPTIYRIPNGLRQYARSLLMLTKEGQLVKLEHLACNFGPTQPDRHYRYEDNRLVDVREPTQEVWDYTYDD